MTDLRILALAGLLVCLFFGRTGAEDGMCTSPPVDYKPGDDAASSCGGRPDTSGSTTISFGSPLNPLIETRPRDEPPPRLIDITHTYAPGMPLWDRKEGLNCLYKWLASDMSKGADHYDSWFSIGAHFGTHIDAPAHYVAEEYNGGMTIDKVDLEALVGHAYVAEVPDDVQYITAEVLQDMHIPKDTERLILKTSNTRRNLMKQREFTSDYAGLTADGAKWLADYTWVKMVGTDYMSIAAYNDTVGTHVELFKRHILAVEALDLSEVDTYRIYYMTCLPLKLMGAEAAPARCILWGPDRGHEAWRLDNMDQILKEFGRPRGEVAADMAAATTSSSSSSHAWPTLDDDDEEEDDI